MSYLIAMVSEVINESLTAMIQDPFGLQCKMLSETKFSGHVCEHFTSPSHKGDKNPLYCSHHTLSFAYFDSTSHTMPFAIGS